MKLLKSNKFKLPTLYFITDRKEINELPIGVPFIYADAKEEEYLIRLLEYEVLYQRAKQSGYPFNFRQILLDNGFEDIREFDYHHPTYMEFVTEEMIDEGSNWDIDNLSTIDKDTQIFKEYVKDCVAYVDVDKLKELNVFPIWLDKIEKAIETNIHNFAVFNNNMYNKKLEGMYGSLDLVSPNRNLIIIDISSSIPKAVSSTCLTLSKNLAETFYADLLITGSKSTLYYYENLYELNITTIYEENGEDNDQVWFRKLVESEEKHYKTCICFGDNHSPSDKWNNKFNRRTEYISREDGQKLCKWSIDKLISFHVQGDCNTAGYADWFKPIEIEKISGWVKYLTK